MSVDLFSDDLDRYDNNAKYAALEEFCSARINEGWRLDYAEVWEDRELEKVAAFANTFGGVLIVGVKKDKRDAEPILVGVRSAAEYKTKIAGSIAANISPVPSYYLYECHKPDQSDLKFCVVQVRNLNWFHLVTKKNVRPVHIRNEDQTLEANASDIRRLLERNGSTQDIQANIERKGSDILGTLRVKMGRSDLGQGRESFTDSPCFLKVVLVPVEFRSTDLDKSTEDKFKRFVRARYPRVQSTELSTVSRMTEERESSFFEWIWYHTSVDWEMRWRITADGRIAHATQIARDNSWSAVDLCDFLFLFLKLSSEWWQYNGYFGDGTVFADMATNNVPISQNTHHGAFGRELNPRDASRDLGWISGDAIRLSTLSRSRAQASQHLSPVTMLEAAIPTVISLTNALLRNLGHLVDSQSLDRNLRSLYGQTGN
jgi:hypothetical protein